jgi:hypothetical protein
MNFLFSTTPLSISQWLICLGVSLPMFFVALLANRLNPQN